LSSESSMALLIASDRPKKVDLAKHRPVGIAEVELAVGTLPQHEARQADLATGPDDQIRIRAIVRIQVLGQRLGGNALEDILGAVLPDEALLEVAFDGIDDLLPPSISNPDIQE